jgi:toxin ParE1/3/4
MLPLRWSARALEKLEALIGHIALSNPGAAETLQLRIESAILPLSRHPYLCRPGRVPGTRELVAHPNYIVVYRVLADCVEIINVLHAKQKYP